MLAELGAYIAIFDIDEKKGEDMQNILGQTRAIFIKVDITNDNSIKSACEKVMEKFG